MSKGLAAMGRDSRTSKPLDVAETISALADCATRETTAQIVTGVLRAMSPLKIR